MGRVSKDGAASWFETPGFAGLLTMRPGKATSAAKAAVPAQGQPSAGRFTMMNNRLLFPARQFGKIAGQGRRANSRWRAVSEA